MAAKTEAAAPMSRKELEAKIVGLAWKDEGFRKAFLANPKGEFEKRLGTTLPPGLRITAVAEDADSLHFVIPAKPGGISEMSDADLEKVAGGVSPVFIIVPVLLTAGAVGSVSVSALASVMKDDKGKW